MAFSERQYRDALGRFATGITVVTCKGKGDRPVGVTINSFNSVSLDPPLVLFSIGRGAHSFDELVGAEELAVNILAEGQEALSSRFAETRNDKFTGIAFSRTAEGCPVLNGTLATLECRPAFHYAGGDHVIIVMQVDRLSYRDDLRPLLYFRGNYERIEGQVVDG
jgi:flavin reductase (DIM6/NTAB) family NADH-FMN oxidoreductase RutF